MLCIQQVLDKCLLGSSLAQTTLSFCQGNERISVPGFLPEISQSLTFIYLRNHPLKSQLSGLKKRKTKLQLGPVWILRCCTKAGLHFWRSGRSCWGSVGQHVGGKLSHSCPYPQARSTPGKEQTGSGVAANKNNNTVVFMGPLAVHQIPPASQRCSLQLGQGGNFALLLCWRHRLPAQGHTWDAFRPSLSASWRAPSINRHAHE